MNYAVSTIKGCRLREVDKDEGAEKGKGQRKIEKMIRGKKAE